MGKLILGIESSCDETAAAVLVDGRRVLSSVVASQDDVHAPYGGVVPELASRRHLEVIVPVGTIIIDAGWSPAGVWSPDELQVLTSPRDAGQKRLHATDYLLECR